MDKEKIHLTEKEGAIVLREDATPEIYAPIMHGQECDEIRFTLAFILYAVEQEEWVAQFRDFVDGLRANIDKLTDKVNNEAAEIMRSKFTIIDGEKE